MKYFFFFLSEKNVVFLKKKKNLIHIYSCDSIGTSLICQFVSLLRNDALSWQRLRSNFEHDDLIKLFIRKKTYDCKKCIIYHLAPSFEILFTSEKIFRLQQKLYEKSVDVFKKISSNVFLTFFRKIVYFADQVWYIFVMNDSELIRLKCIIFQNPKKFL